jgi:hypothetical protein
MPIRQPRSKLVQQETLGRAIELAALKLSNQVDAAPHALILILLDANDEGACVPGPQIQEWAEEFRPDLDIACVVANKEYETWFVAAAETLGDYFCLDVDEQIPEQPEVSRQGKGWVRQHFQGYTETIDQPGLSARMGLPEARNRSPSFDKLCRELEARQALGGVGNPSGRGT